MILTYHVTFGVPFRLDLAEQWGPRVELEAMILSVPDFMLATPRCAASTTSRGRSCPVAPAAYQPPIWSWRPAALEMQLFSSGCGQALIRKPGTAELRD
jgi:hypothetical protein